MRVLDSVISSLGLWWRLVQPSESLDSPSTDLALHIDPLG